MSIGRKLSVLWGMTSRTWIFLAFLVTSCCAEEVKFEGVLVAKVLIGVFGSISTGLVVAILISLGLIILRLNHGPFGVSKTEPKQEPKKERIQPCIVSRPSASTALHMDGSQTRFVSVFSNPVTGTTSVGGNPNDRDSNHLLTGGRHPLISSNRFPSPPSTRRTPTAPAYPTTPEAEVRHTGVMLTPQTLPTAFSPSFLSAAPPHYPSLGAHHHVRSYGIQPGIHLPRQPSFDLRQEPHIQARRATMQPVGYFQHINRIQEEHNRRYYGPSERNMRQPSSWARPNVTSALYPPIDHMF